MEPKELVVQIKRHIAIINDAEHTGDESLVLRCVEQLRELLNLDHADRVGVDEKLEDLVGPAQD